MLLEWLWLVVAVVVSACGRLAQFRAAFPAGALGCREDSLLAHISAGLVLGGGEI